MTKQPRSHRADHKEDQDEPQADYQFKGKAKETPPAPEHLVINPGMTITWNGDPDDPEKTRQLGGVEMHAGQAVPYTDFPDGYSAYLVAHLYERESFTIDNPEPPPEIEPETKPQPGD